MSIYLPERFFLSFPLVSVSDPVAELPLLQFLPLTLLQRSTVPAAVAFRLILAFELSEAGRRRFAAAGGGVSALWCVSEAMLRPDSHSVFTQRMCHEDR